MIYRVIGGACIVAATTTFGMMKAHMLSARVQSLVQIKTALSVLEGEILFSQNHLKRAFLRIAKLVGPDFFFLAVAHALDEVGIGKAWRSAVDAYKKRLFLKDADVRILKTLSAELGMTDRTQQIKNIHRVVDLMDAAIIRAQAEYDNSARLYRSCGVMVGLVVVILLL